MAFAFPPFKIRRSPNSIPCTIVSWILTVPVDRIGPVRQERYNHSSAWNCGAGCGGPGGTGHSRYTAVHSSSESRLSDRERAHLTFSATHQILALIGHTVQMLLCNVSVRATWGCIFCPPDQARVDVAWLTFFGTFFIAGPF